VSEFQPGAVVRYLTPVVVFGAGVCPDCQGPTRCAGCGKEVEGYGLMDATSAWSDCNRADGHLFRVDDITSTNNPERVRIAIYVPADQMSALEDVGYEDSGANRTPALPGCPTCGTAPK
jgi:hypothetical protein